MYMRGFGVDDVGKAFVGGTVVVGGGGGGSEPALVDAAAIEAEGVEVLGVELEALAGLEEGAGNPAGGEAEEAAGRFESGFGSGFDVGGEGFELLNVGGQARFLFGLGRQYTRGMRGVNGVMSNVQSARWRRFFSWRLVEEGVHSGHPGAEGGEEAEGVAVAMGMVRVLSSLRATVTQ